MAKKEFVYTELKKIIKDCLFLLLSFVGFFVIARMDKADRHTLTGSDWIILVLCILAFVAYHVLKLFYETAKFEKSSAADVPLKSEKTEGVRELALRELKKLVSECVYLTVIILVVRIAADTILKDNDNTASNMIFLAMVYLWRTVLCIGRIWKSSKEA